MAKGFHFYHQTQAAETAIKQLISPYLTYAPRITKLVYTPGATVHDLIIMRAIEDVQVSVAAAAAATELVLSDVTFNGDTLESGDWLVVEHSDGTYGAYLVSALATLTVTINALAKAVNPSADVFIMGAIGEAYHSTLKTIASTRTEFEAGEGGIAEAGYNTGTYTRTGYGDPLLIYSANGVNAGTLNYGGGLYVR